jgi:hypothetical protein
MVLKTWISDEEGQTFLKDEKKMRWASQFSQLTDMREFAGHATEKGNQSRTQLWDATNTIFKVKCVHSTAYKRKKDINDHSSCLKLENSK